MALRIHMLRSLFILFIVSLFFIGCGKSNVKWLHYDETNCADKWNYDLNNENLKNNVVAYLDKKGVKVFEIEIFTDTEKETCTQCSCKTGRRIKCKVKKRDISAIKAEGFY